MTLMEVKKHVIEQQIGFKYVLWHLTKELFSQYGYIGMGV